MSSVDSGVDSDSRAVITTKMVALNRFSKDKSFEENMDDYYDIFIAEDGTELFGCKFELCHNVEKHETDIIEHLKQHFFKQIDEMPSNGMPSNSVDINLSDNSTEKLIECKKEIDSDVECIDISDDDSSQSESKNNPLTNNCVNKSEITDNWEEFVAVAVENEKRVFQCKFEDNCPYKTNLRIQIKSHITKHLEVSPKTEFNEYEYWDQCLKGVYKERRAPTPPTEPMRESKPKMETPFRHISKSSKSSSKLKSNSKCLSKSKKVNPSGVKPQQNSLNDCRRETRSSTQTPNTSGLIDINFNQNNTILSLKGMASVKKLDKYIECRVINGFKYFCCNFGQKCEFKSKRSQETANHVHCAHLGFYLECVRPDCDKIFRTPGSWREHQKNHICNFGLYGYQKGVEGVCRNSHLLKFQEKVIIENNQKAYKCIWKGCGFVTRQRTACKRHIHNTHVCPVRKNKVWKKELLKFMELKSHMTDKPILDIKNETFYCSRPQCKAELANEADLRRHESHYCKHRVNAKSVKNGQMSRALPSKESTKPKAVARLVFSPTSPSTSTSGGYTRNHSQDSNANHILKTEPSIRENGHKREERRNPNTVVTNHTNLKSDIREKCEKFIKRKFYDGIHYILCNAPNCKYTTKIEDKIYDHIQKMHSLSSKSHSPSVESSPQLRKRSHLSVESNETQVSKKSKTSVNGEQISQNAGQRTAQKQTQNLTQKIPQNPNKNSSQNSSKKNPKVSDNMRQKSSHSDNNFNDYYKVKRIESEPFYFCEYPSAECRFYTKTKKELFDHMRENHIVFKCDLQNCKREFKTKNLLEVHKRNHICGFGIAGRKATGVCALENVRQYREEVLVNGVYLYECKICEFRSEVKSAVLSHAHNRHIHPAPPPH